MPEGDPFIESVIDAVLAMPRPNREPHPCEEPGCPDNPCLMACPECGWHRPYCCCV